MTQLRAEAIAVYVFRRSSAGRIELLQLRRSRPDDHYSGTWQPVYGGVQEHETAVEAALRELDEETALRPLAFFQVECLESFYFRASDCITMMPVFAAEVHGRAEIRLNHEHDGFRWTPADEIDTRFVWRSQREVLRVLLDQIECGGLAHEFLQIQVD